MWWSHNTVNVLNATELLTQTCLILSCEFHLIKKTKQKIKFRVALPRGHHLHGHQFQTDLSDILESETLGSGVKCNRGDFLLTSTMDCIDLFSTKYTQQIFQQNFFGGGVGSRFLKHNAKAQLTHKYKVLQLLLLFYSNFIFHVY